MKELEENEYDEEGNYKFSKEYFDKKYNQQFETTSFRSKELKDIEKSSLNYMKEFQSGDAKEKINKWMEEQREQDLINQVLKNKEVDPDELKEY